MLRTLKKKQLSTDHGQFSLDFEQFHPDESLQPSPTADDQENNRVSEDYKF